MSNEPYDFGRLYFMLAGPVFLSGILGLASGVIGWPFFLVLLVSLFVLLRVVNTLETHVNTPPKRNRR